MPLEVTRSALGAARAPFVAGAERWVEGRSRRLLHSCNPPRSAAIHWRALSAVARSRGRSRTAARSDAKLLSLAPTYVGANSAGLKQSTSAATCQRESSTRASTYSSYSSSLLVASLWRARRDSTRSSVEGSSEVGGKLGGHRNLVVAVGDRASARFIGRARPRCSRRPRNRLVEQQTLKITVSPSG